MDIRRLKSTVTRDLLAALSDKGPSVHSIKERKMKSSSPLLQLAASSTSRGRSTSSQRSKSWRRNVSILNLMGLSIALSYLFSCHAFHSASSLLSSPTPRISAAAPPLRSMSNMIPQSRGVIVGRKFRATAIAVQGRKPDDEMEQGSFSQNSAQCCSNSRLFPQKIMSPTRSRSSRRVHPLTMMMSTNDSSPVTDNDPSNRPLHVKVWHSLRNILARLWSLLLRPCKLLKSLILARDKEATAGSTKEVDAVVVTEPEQIATEIATEAEPPVSQVEVVIEQQQERKSSESTKVTSSGKVAEDGLPTTRHRAATTAAVDLTGNWTLIVDDTFTSQYENYLRKLGQPMLVRTVAQTVIGSTKEETIQSDDGQKLFIRGMNVRGSWERLLEASEQIAEERDDTMSDLSMNLAVVQGHELKPMVTADGDNVAVASWWENNGTVHHSWVVGVHKYGGGDFENKRYLKDNGNILVCESTFHPRDLDGEGGQGQAREKASVTWRFLREGAIYGDAAVEFPSIFDVLTKDEKEQSAKATSVTETVVESILPTEDAVVQEKAKEPGVWVRPSGARWAIAAPGVDLSGKWKLIINDQFKHEYDEFLNSLGQPLIVRGAAVVMIGNTREETKQSDCGRSLYIRGVNAKGVWERTLASSGSDCETSTFESVRVPVVTADSEKVLAESWWEEEGTVHVCWTYDVKRYGGGAFESRRYLENDGAVYVCESTFHPTDGREKSFLKWKFLREGAAFMPTDSS